VRQVGSTTRGQKVNKLWALTCSPLKAALHSFAIWHHSRPQASCLQNRSLFYFILFFFEFTWVWTQGFAHARQAAYHFSHVSSPFWLDILEIGFYFIPRLVGTTILLFGIHDIARVTGARLFFFFLLWWGLVKFFPSLAWNCNPPNLSLPKSWYYRCELLVLGLGALMIEAS
jgi:hypothetical protein